MDRKIEFLLKAQQLAHIRGGFCLSIEYYNVHYKLQWQCNEGHIWYASYASIKRGSWCPQCKIYRFEEICRNVMEYFFDVKFVKIRPKWLLSPKGAPMELDGYSDLLNIAFEHNGVWHFTNPSKKQLKYVKLKDKLKIQLCHINNVKLIIIPELVSKLKIQDLPQFIFNRCKELNINIPNLENKNLDISNINIDNVYCRNEIIKLRELATLKNGQLISTNYVNAISKLRWRCKLGHEWQASSNSIKNGSWCPKCSHNMPSITDMQQLAGNYSGKCLSNEYNTSKDKLLWECVNGHRWYATPHNIKYGSWCPTCNLGNDPIHSIEEMRQIATKRNGQCLSNIYKSVVYKLTWKCNICDHIWQASAASILRGSWCKCCAVKNMQLKKITPIEEIHQLANKYNGFCLSKEYKNSKDKILWQCANGHVWESKLHDVKRGHWCKLCYFQQRKIKNNEIK